MLVDVVRHKNPFLSKLDIQVLHAIEKIILIANHFQNCISSGTQILEFVTQPAKLDLNKKSFPMQKTIQNFTIDAQGFRKSKNENPPTLEMGVTS